MHLHIKVYIYANAFMKRASATKSCTFMHRIGGGKKTTTKKPKKEAIPIFLFFSEIGNFIIGGPVNQLIKNKRPKRET
jgi:hypothetical protein